MIATNVLAGRRIGVAALKALRQRPAILYGFGDGGLSFIDNAEVGDRLVLDGQH